jgi:predicted nucleic acid-binding protein
MIALDTNIWIYGHDTRFVAKQRVAQQLIAATSPMALLWQVGCEFLAATRKFEPLGFTRHDAWSALEDMVDMCDVVLLPSPEVWAEARRLGSRLSLSIWDSLMLAACLRGGVHTLFSEDMHPGDTGLGPSIVNPFAGAAGSSGGPGG